jgi:hypothetical protein
MNSTSNDELGTMIFINFYLFVNHTLNAQLLHFYLYMAAMARIGRGLQIVARCWCVSDPLTRYSPECEPIHKLLFDHEHLSNASV